MSATGCRSHPAPLPTEKLAADEYARIRRAADDGTFIAADRGRMTLAADSTPWLGGLQIRRRRWRSTAAT